MELPPFKTATSNPAVESAGQLIDRQVGSYHILGLLGAGGMGEVYRALDTKLGREVAIKVLPPAFTSDLERMARFEREARVLASLNHPHIGGIYGLEDSGGIRALVLELVDGTTLADRLAAGLIPIAEVLVTARDIADALEAAHDKGIIQRSQASEHQDHTRRKSKSTRFRTRETVCGGQCEPK
jgi:eukaryotic-like serine/threonine-protein kinase